MTQPTALDIPSEVQELLKRYVKETTTLLGSQLEGILLYGSAVGGEFLPGRSNLNLLLMLTGYEREGLKRYAKAHKRWSREQFVVPLLVTEAELTRPGTVFPLEYLEIQEQHRVLWGRDPFIGMHIDRTHLAYQVQQGIQGNLVRLRQRYIEGGGTEEAMTMLLPLSLTALLPCLRGLQRIAGQPALFQSDALLAGMRTLTGLDLAGLTDVLELKRGIISPGPVEVPRLFERYAANLDALIALIRMDGTVTPAMNRRFSITICSIVGLGLLLLLVAVPVGFAREPVPSYDPQGYVSDHAGVIDAEWRARIRSVCQDLERKTGVEMVVVTVPTLKPYGSANDYAVGLYQKWGIGSVQNEHGVLVLLSVQERQAAVTMGRRMLPVMGGNVVGKVGHEYLDPAVKNGHFGEGLYRTVVGLASVSQEIRVGSIKKTHFRGLGFWITIFTVGGALWFLWWLSRPDLRHPYGRLRRGEYWGSGQGGFGGNFGGHGGGMSGEGWK